MEIMGYDGKPYEKVYDPETGRGWLATTSALCRVISVCGRTVFTRFVSPSTGDMALVYLASEDHEDNGVAHIVRRQNGDSVDCFSVSLIDFINGDYKLPEKGEL